MILYFGLQLDDYTYPQAHHLGQVVTTGVRYIGPQELLLLFESYFGMGGYLRNNMEYLRIEQYRQALLRHLKTNPEAFYNKSFKADRFATAVELLSRRDELMLNGWDFAISEALPDRLQTIASIEELLHEKNDEGENILTLSHGYSDRFRAILDGVETHNHPINHFFINEPFDILPHHLQLFFGKMQKQGVAFTEMKEEEHEDKKSDLGVFKTHLLERGAGIKKSKIKLKADSSLLIIRAKREVDAAAYTAKLLHKNPDYRPVCIIPEKNRALDNAFIQEGLPSLGILSESLARPILQILKLAPSFLWKPIDPFKILEFVSLSVKPLRGDLAHLIAEEMAKTPGLKSDNWNFRIKNYFEKLEERARHDKSIKVAAIRKEYNFWFDRPRYDANGKVPIEQVVEIFDYIKKWASKSYEDGGNRQTSLLVLREQARRIVELLGTLSKFEKQLTYLSLERIVRTIYEPSPILFKETEVGHTPFVYYSSAIIGRLDKLLWCNFIKKETEHFFSKWYKPELEYLNENKVFVPTPAQENERLIWQRNRAILHTHEQLILLIPEMLNGSVVQPHPLLGDLEATFSNIDSVTLNIDNQDSLDVFEKKFNLPKFEPVPHYVLGKPRPFVYIQKTESLDVQEYETSTSLNDLFYYPYKWIFEHKIKLSKSPILSIGKDNKLKGNLAHKLFEKLFKFEDIKEFNQAKTEEWVDEKVPRLLAREGAVLLMYGREPERASFVNRMKYAIWSLIQLIQNNGWEVYGTEMPLTGQFQNIPIKGKADLVLKRREEMAIIDFKWRGENYRRQSIKNEEDLQLILYSKLLTTDESWAHTAYFIMETGKMIARNEDAFKGAEAVQPEDNHKDVNNRIWLKMKDTFDWRMEQIKKGKIEIRTEQTVLDIEDDLIDQGMTTNELEKILEMKSGDAPFDDFRTLINSEEI